VSRYYPLSCHLSVRCLSCADETSIAQWAIRILTCIRRDYVGKFRANSRGADGGTRAIVSSHAARMSSRLCHGNSTSTVRVFPLALQMSVKKDATDCFMRVWIRCCYSVEWFILLLDIICYCPKFRENTLVQMFRCRSSMPERRRVASLNEFIFYQKMLHLEIQFPSLEKEEGANW
jgi:hypothetical protein